MRFVAAFVSLVLAACGGGGGESCSVTVQIEGDSIAKQLGTALPVGARVINTAIGSTTTSDRISGAAGFQPFPQGVSGSVYFTNWGVNDAYLQVPLVQYKANLRRIAATPGAVLMTPTPMDLSQPYTADDSAYAQGVRDIGLELNVPVLDAQAWLLAKPNWQSALVDGVHLSATAQDAMVRELVAPGIQARIQGLCP